MHENRKSFFRFSCTLSGVVPRVAHEAAIGDLLRQFPVVGLIGARQVGKTTLARRVIEAADEPVTLFDLEDPTHEARLSDPKLALEPLRGLVVIDEVQRKERLFELLRVLVDRPGNTTRFLVLGSAGPDLLRQSSETLAGRIAYHELTPFRTDETGAGSIDRLWLRGGFPGSFLAPDEGASVRWRQAFIRTFLERNLPQLGVSVPATTMRRFWAMVAHYHGSHWNSAEIGRALGVSGSTIGAYLDALVDALVVRRLAPWYESLKKRQIKAPRVYVADTGLLHALLALDSGAALLGHPKAGASWEGFAMQEAVRILGVDWDRCSYWATHQGAELDLLVFQDGRRIGFEFKRTSAPRLTRSMRTAMVDLSLDRLFVVFPGDLRFRMSERVEAVGLACACAEGL